MYKRNANILFRLVVVLVLGVTMLSACASAASPYPGGSYAESMSKSAAPPAPMEAPAAAMQESGYGGGGNSFAGSATTPQQAVERIVIKNADMTLVVSDPPGSMDRISKLAEEMGGFVVSADLSEYTLDNGVKVPQASITIRVPAEKLDQALNSIRAESDRLPISEKITSQDVTSEYTDLQSRLRNLEAAEQQLTKIMEQATKTEDVLSVYNQLVQVREQIEVIKGQIKYYEESAALSSVAVNLTAKEAAQPLTIGEWQPSGIVLDALQALIDALKGITKAVIWIVIFVLPVLTILFIIFVLPFILLIVFWRRRRARRKAAQPALAAKPQPASVEPAEKPGPAEKS
jgi:hypothetical protein